MTYSYVGYGVYTYPDLMRIVGITRTRIKGLVDGHIRQDKSRKPIINKRSFIFENKEYFSFLDLIEIKFIKHFLDQGVPRKNIILAYNKLKEEFKKEHPFATKFVADNTNNIFMDNEKDLVSSLDNQVWMRELAKMDLLEGIDFENELAARWYPYKDELPEIVLDPEYNYGMPILKSCNIKTSSIYDAYVAEQGNADVVADWFNIPVDLVNQAVKYETRLGI